jgi:hypothetical protein
MVLESLQSLVDGMRHRWSQFHLVLQNAQIDSGTLSCHDVGNGPQMPGTRFGILAGAVDHEKVGAYHSGRALCGHITLVIGRKINLCMPDPEIVDIVRMLGGGKVKQCQVCGLCYRYHVRGTPYCGSAIDGWHHAIAGWGITTQFLHEGMYHHDENLRLLHGTGALMLHKQLTNGLQIAALRP